MTYAPAPAPTAEPAPQTHPTLTLPAPFATSPDPPSLLTQGAEAIIYKISFLTPSTSCALKYRPPKPYRHPTLDKRLTKARLLAEARVLVKCRREGVRVPAVLAADWEAGWVGLEWVEGGTVRGVLDGWVHREEKEGAEGEGGKEKEMLDLMMRVGRAVGRMHEIGVCHGDLTTSNLMLRPFKKGKAKREEKDSTRDTVAPTQSSREAVRAQLAAGKGTVSAERETAMTAESTAPAPAPVTQDTQEGREKEDTAGSPTLAGDIVLIDFGLATQSSHDEDRAVDLYVLERAFAATHPAAEPLFREVLRCYGESYKGARVVLKRLEEVRMRGRKRSMLG
ncbi:kinase-like protein [Lepidopterella palustris CBS 459.81]|uniref:EKC/KEOPS complex subunit BUD32 n=1 Tax=Lepidopterella palustris CBS 459.81 TaxID=1314670 RepID=A0A8E2EEI1_9PEZI|nr:kinase-like protein [Lepidopterella palustris CBS 459.81]